MCPLVLVGSGMKEVDICMDEHKYSAIVSVTLDKAFDWVEVFRSMRVYSVR